MLCYEGGESESIFISQMVYILAKNPYFPPSWKNRMPISSMFFEAFLG